MNRWLFYLFLLLPWSLHAQDTTQQARYEKAFQYLDQMRKVEKPANFEEAVFIVENTYYQGQLSRAQFSHQLDSIALHITQYLRKHSQTQYEALFTYFTQPHPINNYQPFTYDFADPLSAESPEHGFVSRLLRTHTGNHHALCYLYILLAQRLKCEAYIAVAAPHHLYIKYQQFNGQWVNVELAGRGFPSDSWFRQQMGMSQKQLDWCRCYLLPLDEQASIGLCLLDLVQAYRSQLGFRHYFYHLTLQVQAYPIMQGFMEKMAMEQYRMEQERNRQQPRKKKMKLRQSAMKHNQQSLQWRDWKPEQITLYLEWLQQLQATRTTTQNPE